MNHVFLSYVGENRTAATYVHDVLRSNRVEVWLDRPRLLPGQDWMSQIRTAIADGAFFVPLFSSQWRARNKSVANEELLIAVAELRQRNYDRTWLVPVRINVCEIPKIPIGADRFLTSLHCADLMLDDQEAAFGAFLRALNVKAPNLKSVDPLGVRLKTIDEPSAEPDIGIMPLQSPVASKRKMGQIFLDDPAIAVTVTGAGVLGVALGKQMQRHGSTTPSSTKRAAMLPRSDDTALSDDASTQSDLSDLADLVDNETIFAFGDDDGNGVFDDSTADDGSEDAPFDDSGS